MKTLKHTLALLIAVSLSFKSLSQTRESIIDNWNKISNSLEADPKLLLSNDFIIEYSYLPSNATSNKIEFTKTDKNTEFVHLFIIKKGETISNVLSYFDQTLIIEKNIAEPELKKYYVINNSIKYKIEIPTELYEQPNTKAIQISEEKEIYGFINLNKNFILESEILNKSNNLNEQKSIIIHSEIDLNFFYDDAYCISSIKKEKGQIPVLFNLMIDKNQKILLYLKSCEINPSKTPDYINLNYSDNEFTININELNNLQKYLFSIRTF